MNHKRRAKKLSLVRGEHTLIVGVDIAKNKHWACIMDGLTELPVGSPFAFQNTRDGFLRLLEMTAKALKRTGAARVVVGMEPSGHYWKPLATFLLEHGFTVVTVSPVHVKRAKEFDDNSPTKNDRKDAWVIARRVNDGDFFHPYLPQGVYADLRVLTQARQEQRLLLNQALNQLHGILDEYFPEFTTVFADPLGLAAMHVLRHYPFPADILAVPVAELATDLKRVTKGRVGMKKALQLQEAAQRSGGVKNGLEAARQRLRQRLDAVAFCQAQLADTEAAMELALQKTGVAPYLLSVPGIGIVTAATLLGEAGDLTRYEDWRQLRKLAGYNLKENSSGEHQGRTRISKRGRPGLRCLLYQAAMVLVARNAQFKALYRHFKIRPQNPLKGKQAVVAVACKLLRVLFTLVRKQRFYDPLVVLGEFRTTQIGLVA
jgi:transposase